MQKTTAIAVVGALMGLTATIHPHPAHSEPITIEQALARATQRPSIQVASLDVDASRAAVRGADAPLYNPEVSASVGPQFGAGWSIQIGVGLALTIERGGKRAARTALAEAASRGADAARVRSLLVARIETWRAFQHALVVRDRLATRAEVEQLATALATAMQRSVLAGGTTKLRANLAAADAGRARQERFDAEIAAANTLAELAAAIGAPPTAVLEPVGEVGAPAVVAASVDDAVARALRGHPDVAARAADLALARARIDDADARGVPDPTVGLGYAYAPDPDGAHAVVASIALPLAWRNANRGERAVARVDAQRAELELARERVDVERRVRLAYANDDRARAAVAGFDREITDHLHDNLVAAQEAFTRGGLDFVELTTTQRELVAARIAFLDARLAAIDAWAALALAASLEVTR
ncbi:MAG: TolC family protein [Proteobacteria bacterium]|nr:TolC family protein [Pseudomonadota bacterium]